MFVIARLVLRYIAGALIAKGLLDATTAVELAQDPDLIDLLATALASLVTSVPLWIGTLAGIATEWWYKAAKRLGWAT